MMVRKIKYIIGIVALLFVSACGRPETRVEKLIEQYQNKQIANVQLLLGLGELYQANKDNELVKSEYFNRMIISGYGAWALHYYLAAPEKIADNQDEKIILFALRKGNHFAMAKKFNDYFSSGGSEKLQELINLSDSLVFYNDMVSQKGEAVAYANRGRFFSAVGADDVSGIDLTTSLKADPCNPDGLFQRALALFDRENTKEVIRIIGNCHNHPNQPEWMQVFEQLARDIEAVIASADSETERLYQLANLYVNNGFSTIALRKSGRLIQLESDRADYLALHAFVYYRMGDKRMATRYLNDAEAISGSTSRLRSMIEQME